MPDYNATADFFDDRAKRARSAERIAHFKRCAAKYRAMAETNRSQAPDKDDVEHRPPDLSATS